jgi:hypothetical protein
MNTCVTSSRGKSLRALAIGTVVLVLGGARPAAAAERAAQAHGGQHRRTNDPDAQLRRFALIVSSNDGGATRGRLRFAESDARSVADVLRQLGGLRDPDLILLTGARRNSLQSSFDRMKALVAGAPRGGGRREILVYYSGHSDETGLMLGNDRVSYGELRRLIDTVDADVRIAILDSCASGALIRLRGGTRRPGFLANVSTDTRGYAFLTASSADEAAQESDRIGAAFFTHYLLSGLRGGADVNRDGLITLSESYQFAYHETLQRTEQTAAGAQHPTYDFQLAGKGDLVVLTDIRSTGATLVLGDQLSGRVYIRDSSGRLLVELRKYPPHPIELGVGPGEYRVLLESNGRAQEAVVSLGDGQSRRLDGGHFTPIDLQSAVARGDIAAPGARADSPASQPLASVRPPASLTRTLIGEDSLVGRTTSVGGYAGLSPRYTRLGGQDAFMMNLEAAVLLNRRFAIGLMAGGGFSGRIDPQGNRLTLGYAALMARQHFFCDSSAFCLSVGASAGAGGVEVDQRDDGPMAPDQSRGDALFLFEPQVGGHLNLTRFMRLGVDVGYRLVAGADNYPTADLRGFTAGFHIQLGWF